MYIQQKEKKKKIESIPLMSKKIPNLSILFRQFFSDMLLWYSNSQQTCLGGDEL